MALSFSQDARTETPPGTLAQFLAWVAARPRNYAETMDAWRTSCPRLSAWEDATADGLVRVEPGDAGPYGKAAVLLTERGEAALAAAQAAPAVRPR